MRACKHRELRDSARHVCCRVLPVQAVTPPSAGVYDPITATWKILPQRLSAAYSLDFAPRKLFEEQAFVKRSK